MLNHKLFIFLILPLFLLIPSEAKMKLSKTMHQDIEKKYEQSKMKQKKLNGALVVYEEQDTHLNFTIDGTNKEEEEDYTSFHFNGKLNNKHLPQESEMRAIAQKEVQLILPSEIADSCSVTVVGYEYQQRDQDSVQVVGSTIIMHRLIDGLPVRGGSYIELFFDSTTTLLTLNIKWPKYKQKRILSKSTLQEQKENHQNKLDSYINHLNEETSAQGIIIEGEITQAVSTIKEWQDLSGKRMLVPAITYIGECTEQGKKHPVILDLPVDETIISDEPTLAQYTGDDYE